MTKQELAENKANLAASMFDAIEAVYASGNTFDPDLAVLSIVSGYMLAFKKLVGEEEGGDTFSFATGKKLKPAEPKQRRARRKKADIVALAAEVAND